MYAKLFASILDSSLWETPLPTRVLFVTLLAMADRKGYVYSSPRGLSRRAVLDDDQLTAALDELMAPDPHSTDRLRNPEAEGRRIEETIGGWHILNYEYYRDLRDEDERREQNRQAQKASRSRRSVTGQPSSASVSTGQHGKPSESHQSQINVEAEESKAGTPAPSAAKPPAPRPSKRKTPPDPLLGMTAAWQPSSDVLSNASEQYPGVNLDAVIRDMRQYWITNGKRRNAKGWDKTFNSRLSFLSNEGKLPDQKAPSITTARPVFVECNDPSVFRPRRDQ